MEQSEHKQHSSVVCHLIRVQFVVFQNNYNINIKSHWSQITIANAIIIVRELPKCDTETRRDSLGLSSLCMAHGCLKNVSSFSLPPPHIPTVVPLPTCPYYFQHSLSCPSKLKYFLRRSNLFIQINLTMARRRQGLRC